MIPVKISKLLLVRGFVTHYSQDNNQDGKRRYGKIFVRVHGGPRSATPARVCLLALSHSGRRLAVCPILLRAGPITGCSAVPAVRNTVVIGAWFLSSWCAQKKQVPKQQSKKAKKHHNKKKGKQKQSTDRSGKTKIPVRN